jgi:hypothetical protein
MSKTLKCPQCGKPAQKNGTKGGEQQWTCRRVGCGYGNIVAKYKNKTKKNNPDKVMAKNNGESTSFGLNEQQLRAKHDLSFIVKKAVQQLKKGAFLTDAEFIQKAGLRASAGYRNVLDHPDFSKYRAKAGGTIYWSHPESIEKMKHEGVLN